MKAKHTRLLYVLISMTALAGATFFILNGLKQNITYFYSPTDLATKPPQTDEFIRVGGYVVKESYRYDSTANAHYFSITDTNAHTAVAYKGLLPALFREGQTILAEGHYINNQIVSKRILAKHDEKYQPPEITRAIEKVQP